MRPLAGSAARTALRAGLIGAGVVGGHLLLSLFAGPAHAGPADEVGGGLLGDLPLVELAGTPDPADVTEPDIPEPAEAPDVAEPVDAVAEVAEPVVEVAEPVVEVAEPVVEVAEPVAEVAEPVAEVAEAVTRTATGTAAGVTDPVTESLTGVVAGTGVTPLVQAAGESVDQLVAGVDTTVESTVAPLTSTVDAALPAPVAPVVEDIADPVALPPLPLAAPAPAPLAAAGAVRLDLLPPEVAAVPALPADPATGPATRPPTSPPLIPVIVAPVAFDPPALRAAPAAETGHDPRAARPPPPAIPKTQHLAGDSFDPGHPWPWTGPPTAAHDPDPGSPRSADDIAYSSLVMPVSAPPG